MNERDATRSSCTCGKRLEWETAGDPPEDREITCPCGRKYELERAGAGWAPRLEPLTPEARQPLAGFSTELKDRSDCQRYYFSHRISGHRLPVHLLFSPSAGEAEVKTGDMKPLRIAPVRSPVEARRRWIEWFDSRTLRHGRPTGGPSSRQSAPTI
jgi:hypothetical protein